MVIDIERELSVGEVPVVKNWASFCTDLAVHVKEGQMPFQGFDAGFGFGFGQEHCELRDLGRIRRAE